MSVAELPGLPGEPPYPVQIALPGISTFREGYALKFEPELGLPWIGNIQCGAGSHCAFLELHTDRVAVVAGGQGYVIDAVRQVHQHTFGGDVMCLIPIEGTIDFLAVSNIDIERHGSTNQTWRTQRIAWDGLSQVRIERSLVLGRARHFDDSWHDFKVELSNGNHAGGAYEREA